MRPIKRVTLWNRTRSRAVSTAFALSAAGIEPLIAEDLEAAVRTADIVSCATLSAEPLIRGTSWSGTGGQQNDVASSSDYLGTEMVSVPAFTKAVRAAKAYVTDALAAANRIKIGSGHGPVHHFHAWW